MSYLEGECFECKQLKKMRELKRCTGCLSAVYCGPECQKAHWSHHKPLCTKPGGNWFDKHRSCRDGSAHQGKLELVTWRGTDQVLGEELGWGAVVLDEEEDLKRKFADEYGSNKARFFKYRPDAFRWTCCGISGGMNWGCDHHSAAYPQPCTCDFCRMGKPVPASTQQPTQYNKGLKLSCGPDPRSYNPELAAINATARTMMGLEM